MKQLLQSLIVSITIGILLPAFALADFTVPDTLQTSCFDTTSEITCPAPGEPFYGQDAQYTGDVPAYTLSADNLTVFDATTGLTWVKLPDTDGDGDLDSDDKVSWTYLEGLVNALNSENFGGYNDWRVPSIKELYSLIDFRGRDISGPDPQTFIPFIDTDYFDFAYGDESAGERLIDAQYVSATEYVSTTMGGDATVFGVNFADGRIKGYPRDTGPGGGPMAQFIRCVRDADAAPTTPTPTPTPDPDNPRLELEMPASYFQPGDTCYLDAVLTNPSEALTDVPLVVILDIHGLYWFWPAWDRELDYQTIDLETGQKTVSIIPEFTWPDTGTATLEGLVFWGAMLTPDLTEILGGVSSIGYFQFGFGG